MREGTMPIYEYVCNDCKTEFEVLVKMEEKTSCPVCDSESLTKRFSTFGISTGPSHTMPPCAGGCGGGFDAGSCGSGGCCG